MNTPTTVSSAAEQPLRIWVTAAGRENLVLRALARVVIPILRAPESVSPSERLQLAETLTCALGGAAAMVDLAPPDLTDADVPLDTENYEPGCRG